MLKGTAAEEVSDSSSTRSIFWSGRSTAAVATLSCQDKTCFSGFVPLNGASPVTSEIVSFPSHSLELTVTRSRTGLSHSLTGISFIVQVRLAAGRERAEEQFPLIMSPILYRDRIPVIDGRSSGSSAHTERPGPNRQE